jgi:glycosyltransferase involved in cell wall biosynthesis
MMNILQVCNKPPYPSHDGGTLASYSLMRSLSRLGHQVTLLTMCTPKHNLSDADRDFLTSMIRLHTVNVDTSLSAWGFLKNLAFSQLPYNAERFLSSAFEQELIKTVTSASFDVVQLEGIYLMPYAETIHRYSPAKVALRAHNIEQEIWKRISQTEKNPLKKAYFHLLTTRLHLFEQGAVNRYDLLVPITERDKEEFNRMGNVMPSFVCPATLEGYDLPGPVPIKPSSSLFFLGSLDWKPNQEGLLWFINQVFPKVKIHYPNITFHVAGRNAPRWLAKRIVGNGILFHGEIPDASQFMREHGILVSPCFSGGGMRVKIIEAMNHGKPVVATTIGAEGLNTVHDKNILIGDSASEFADHIDRLLKFPDFYIKIGTNALSFVRQNFDNMKITADLATFYKTYAE